MTLQQFGRAFLKVILFLAIWAVVLLAAIYLSPRMGLSDNQVAVLILILTPLIFISFLPYLNGSLENLGSVAKIFKRIKNEYILQLNKGKTGKGCTLFTQKIVLASITPSILLSLKIFAT